VGCGLDGVLVGWLSSVAIGRSVVSQWFNVVGWLLFCVVVVVVVVVVVGGGGGAVVGVAF